MGRCQKVPKFDFQIQFSVSEIIGIFLSIFISGKNMQYAEHFFVTCSWRFLRSDKLEQLEFKLEKIIGIWKSARNVKNYCLLFSSKLK